MRGRFAPSPTGRLHLGNAFTALLSWLQVRAAGGTFLLRIEDLDPARSRPKQTDELLRDLDYLGLHWDEPPLFQSRRGDLYRAALDQLHARGLTYPCFCSRAEIARAASAPHGPSEEGPRYPGTCAALTADEQRARAASRPSALRFRVPPGEVAFEDLRLGRVSQDVAQAVGDFAVQRPDGVASYQLAVVVDDADSGITHVLRGEDLASSTPRQLLLYRALGRPPPLYAHTPLLLAPDGKRLAKREGPMAVAELRRAGVPSERVIGLLASWAGLAPPDAPPTPAEALVPEFRLDRLSPRPPPVSAALLEPLGYTSRALE